MRFSFASGTSLPLQPRLRQRTPAQESWRVRAPQAESSQTIQPS